MENMIAFLAIATMISMSGGIFFYYKAKDLEEDNNTLEDRANKDALEYLEMSKQNESNQVGILIIQRKLQEVQTKLVTEMARNVTLESELDVLAYDRREMEQDYNALVRDTTDVVYYDRVNDVLVYSGDLVKVGDFDE